MKTRIVETAPSAPSTPSIFLRPDFESIIRILKGVEVDIIKLYEDLYFDVKRVLIIY